MKALKILALSFCLIMFNLAQLNYANTSTTATDQEIESAIQAKMSGDKTVSDLGVKITSKSGMVTIAGNVNTDAEASKIVEIVSSTDGVNSTNTTQLKVKTSNQPFTDTVITAEVKGSFIREKLFGEKDVTPMSVSVETKNSVVYLTGKTTTKEQADNAVKLAKAVHGVKRVVSKIEVQAG